MKDYSSSTDSDMDSEQEPEQNQDREQEPVTYAEEGMPQEMPEGPVMFVADQTVGSGLCCKCGVSMQPNAANMCLRCLRTDFDITEGLLKRVSILYCPECETYLQPPNTWIRANLELIELLTFCLKRLNLVRDGVRLMHADFVWTEPHSKRIKVKLKIQKEVLNGAILEQAYIVEYEVHHQMCENCSKLAANSDQWVASSNFSLFS